MKLSLYSQLVKQGDSFESVFNDGEMRRKIFDVKIEGTLHLSPESKGIICLLSVNPLGCMIYAIQPLFSRMGDYSALILAVPKQVIFDASKDIPTIYDAMMRCMADESDVSRLRPYFDREYKESDFAWPLSGASSGYAYRIYGGRSKASGLSSLLGIAMMQEEYSQYEGIFLLSQGQANLVRAERMTDLTSHVIAQPALVSPPAKSRIPHGCKLFVGDEEMTSTLLCHVGDVLRLSLKRDGFDDHPFRFSISDSVTKVPIPDNIPWNYRVYQSFFSFVDEKDKRVPSDKIRVDIDGVLETHKNYSILPENLAQRAHVHVSSNIYEPVDLKTVNLMSYNKANPLKVILKKQSSKVIYRVIQDDSNPIEIPLVRAIDEKMTSPLTGFEVTSEKKGVVMLQPISRKESNKKRESKGWKTSKRQLTLGGICLLAGLILGGAVGWLTGVPHGEDKHKALIAQQIEVKKKKAQQRADSLAHVSIIAYLDSVPKWKKQEMDSIFDGKLKGLYDNLNYYSFDNVNAKIEELKLNESKEIQKLDSAINLMYGDAEYQKKLKEITINEDENGNELYSKDNTITLDNYFKQLETARKAVDSITKKASQ